MMDQGLIEAVHKVWSLMVLSLSVAAGLFFLAMIVIYLVKIRAGRQWDSRGLKCTDTEQCADRDVIRSARIAMIAKAPGGSRLKSKCGTAG